MQMHTIESLLEKDEPSSSSSSQDEQADGLISVSSSSLAMLMLTSGSTGNSKAVQISHRQALASVAGKSLACQLPLDRPFLNWIGLDHVGALMEIHMHALWYGVDQIHVATGDIISSPKTFLQLLSRHQVSRSFAPNFFLARLVSTVDDPSDSSEPSETQELLDLSNLRFLVSGGEANDINTCVAVSSLLYKFGAPHDVVAPGFGMTETCAGCIYNTNCPEYDVQNDHAVASLGKCVKGINMRVALSGLDSDFVAAAPGEPGALQVSGPIVFQGYYRNEAATAKAFTEDGWFITGDRAAIDANGNLNMIGRTDDVININGVKIATADLQTSLEVAVGSRVSRIVVFGSRAAHTEQVTVAYVPPGEWPMDPEAMADIETIAGQVCLLAASTRPLVFAVGAESQPIIPISALGKISRAKMRSLLEAGRFDRDLSYHQETLTVFKKNKQNQRRQDGGGAARVMNKVEEFLMNDIASARDLSPEDFDVDTPFFDLGFSSMDLIKLKHKIDRRFGITVPLIKLLKNPTAQSLAAVLGPEVDPDYASTTNGGAAVPVQPAAYDPIVTLRSGGSKAPLWLVHPGVGEVLVFVGLAKQMVDDDRPVYALRARGFDKGQSYFTNIDEAVDTYVGAIRQRQPQGPYAIAGYSYGTMLAFEISKKLNIQLGPSSVQFLGSFNLPPHIKFRMRQLSWNMCLLSLSYFIGLTTQEYADGIDQDQYQLLSRPEALKQVLSATDYSRMEEFGLTEPELVLWANLAFGLQSMAVDYDPSGLVDSIDIFHAAPLKIVAASQEIWVRDHLSKWADFSDSPPRFHHVKGAHYTMIDADHVVEFANTLKLAIKERGL
jgi:acyl-CoA synthetase (AMP-forming)/AMP-acid ligase II/thioesterase domain-containing protein/acyl carrier protein